MLSSVRKYIFGLIVVRFIIISIILAVNCANFGFSRSPTYFLIIIAYVLTIIYFFLLFLKIYHVYFRYIQIFLDIVFETLMVHFMGGIDSAITILYPLTSISASIIISPRAGIFFALLGSIFYSGVVLLEYYRIIPFGIGFIPALYQESSYLYAVLYFRVAVFCIIGFLGSYVAELLKRKNREVLSLEEKLKQEDRLSALGKLAANTAHEIRNPLASISGCVEALKANLKLDGENERLFNLIINETARLNNIINGLLEYVKPRKLKFEKMLLDELLEEVITLVKNSKDFNKNKIEIRKENAASKLKIECDSQQIRQVFFNLLINAVEAISERGEIIVSVEFDKLKRLVDIEVADNGCGMSKERLENLFMPFSSGKEMGVGLGLAIAYNIVKEHGGKIEVMSRLGKGSAFIVSLPVNNK